jgi:glutamyl-tRNA reductase
MIIGEYEILGQVKQALEAAEKAKVVNLPLRRLFQSAIRTGRRAREETEISKNALSVGSVAVDLAARVVGDFGDCKMMVIGTGEAGRLVAKAARDRGTSQIVVASRTRERASALAAVLGGIPVSLNNLVEELSTCNIVVTCASAPRQILDSCRVKSAMKARPELPLVIIDIAVPRNVASAVSKINNVFLYNIDDLTQVSNLNREQREEEIRQVEKIILAELVKFNSWQQALEFRPTVSALMKKAEGIRRRQLEQTIGKLHYLSDEERDSLEAMTRSIVTKILKDPICRLRATAGSNHGYAELVRELFQLDMEKPE